MVTNKQLAESLMTRLNQFAGTLGKRKYQFFIHSNEGEFNNAINGTQKQLPTVLVNAVLLEQSSTPLPLRGLGSVLLMQTLQVLVPCDTSLATGRADYALQALNAFVADVAGNAGNMKDADGNEYAYVLSMSTPFVGVENYFGQVGEAVPVTLQVSWQFIADGVLANNVKITLGVKDSEDIPKAVVLMDGAIVRTRTGTPSNVDGSEEMQTDITQQGLTLKLIMPYKRTDASLILYRDMIKGNLKRVYNVTYDDSVDWSPAEGIVQSWNMVAREITASLTAGMGITITATFEIARDEES